MKRIGVAVRTTGAATIAVAVADGGRVASAAIWVASTTTVRSTATVIGVTLGTTVIREASTMLTNPRTYSAALPMKRTSKSILPNGGSPDTTAIQERISRTIASCRCVLR